MERFRAQSSYYGVFSVFWIVGFGVLSVMGYKESFLWLNGLHFRAGDLLFPHMTHLADGIFISCVFGFRYVKRDLGWAISFLLGMLLLAWVMNIMKYSIFNEWFRPGVVFGNAHIHYITLENECCNTFPSGHSAAAAAMFTFLIHPWRKKLWGIGVLAAVFAIVLAYSRVYIGVHFLGDILVGSLLGVLIPSIFLYYIEPVISEKLLRLSVERQRNLGFFLRGLVIFLILFDIYRVASRIYHII